MNQYHWKRFCSFLIFPWICFSLISLYLFLHEFLNFNHSKIITFYFLGNNYFIPKPNEFLWRNCFSFLKHYQIYLFLIQYPLCLCQYSMILFYHILISSWIVNHFFLLSEIFIPVNIFLKNCLFPQQEKSFGWHHLYYQY